MTFSRRTAWPREPNAFSQLRAEHDLTVSNPTLVGFATPLSFPTPAVYEPHALGAEVARDAVKRYYAERHVEPGHVAITASTSEAYHTLFTVLADPGEAILVPTPSYPLFAYLADVAGVRVDTYPLRYDGDEWHADLRGAIKKDTKAVVVVSPNNPTGSITRALDVDLPLIVDEVFADYVWRRPKVFLRQGLTFALSGLSKVSALPQVKLGWISVTGKGADEALARIELVQDCFLSVSAGVQHALPQLLDRANEVQPQILARIHQNLDHLDDALRGTPITRLAADGGWTAVLRLPATHTDDEWVTHLASKGVLVHPGHFYDLGPAPHVVISLITAHDTFRAGVARLREQMAW